VPNPSWASLVPPFLSKRMRAFQNQRKFVELLEGVTWLVGKANVRVHFIFFVKLHRFTFETLWQLSPQVPIRRIVEKPP
jgi:hypothetical protein